MVGGTNLRDGCGSNSVELYPPPIKTFPPDGGFGAPRAYQPSDSRRSALLHVRRFLNGPSHQVACQGGDHPRRARGPILRIPPCAVIHQDDGVPRRVQPVQHLRDGRAPGAEGGGGGGGPGLNPEGTGDGSRLVAVAEKSRERHVLTPEDGAVALRNSFSHSAGGGAGAVGGVGRQRNGRQCPRSPGGVACGCYAAWDRLNCLVGGAF